jgi:hypothetical protein
MKFEVTNPKAWKAVNEKDMPMSDKIKVYEKLGGAYRLGEDGGEQVFNKLTELLKHRIGEGDESSPEETLMGLKNMAMGDLERIGDYANMILQRMEKGQELSSWMYSQITLAVDQLNSVHDSMDGKDGVKEPLKEGAKRFYELDYGDSKYVIQYYDGQSYHSIAGTKQDAYSATPFLNKSQAEKFKKELLKKGYREDDRMRKESVNEVTDTTYTIHRMTDAGQNAVQNFIDDNGLDAEKLLKYIKSNPQAKYDVRDYIAGTKGTVGGDSKLRTKFIKIFKEPLKEGKYDSDLDKIEAVVKNATSFMNVGAELKKAGIKYGFHTSTIPMYLIALPRNKDNAIVICNKKYVSGADREVNDIAIGLLN